MTRTAPTTIVAVALAAAPLLAACGGGDAPAAASRGAGTQGDVALAVAVGNGDEAPAASSSDTGTLPPGLAQALFAGPAGSHLDALEPLDLGMDDGSDPLPLVIGSSGIVDDVLGEPPLPDPDAAADAALDPLL